MVAYRTQGASLKVGRSASDRFYSGGQQLAETDELRGGVAARTGGIADAIA